MRLDKRLLVIGSGSWNAPIWRGLKQAVTRMQARSEPVLHLWMNSDPEEGRELVEEFRPEVVIFCGCGRLGKQAFPWIGLLKSLRGIPRGYWMNDLRPARKAHEIRGLFEVVFLCWSKGTRAKNICRGTDFSIAKWGAATGARVMYMPQGAGIYPRLQEPGQIRESIFIGNTHASRWHDGRNDLAGRLGVEVVNNTTRIGRDRIEAHMPVLYRETRYCLSMSPRVPGYTSARTYKILSCGGLMLLQSFPGASFLFNHREHALLFDHHWQARRLMDEYREEPEQRRVIAEAGWRLEQERHTVEQRLRNMVANLTTSDQSFWGYL